LFGLSIDSHCKLSTQVFEICALMLDEPFKTTCLGWRGWFGLGHLCQNIVIKCVLRCLSDVVMNCSGLKSEIILRHLDATSLAIPAVATHTHTVSLSNFVGICHKIMLDGSLTLANVFPSQHIVVHVIRCCRSHVCRSRQRCPCPRGLDSRNKITSARLLKSS
jgi:hypothetical protein